MYCVNCGKKIKDGAKVCPYCYRIQAYGPSSSNREEREHSHSVKRPEKKTANYKMALICFFFGVFGVHKFIEGKIGMGILYLLTFGLFGIGWIIDIARYLSPVQEEETITTISYVRKPTISESVEEVRNLSQADKIAMLESYIVHSPGINLSNGEVCYYAGPAQSYHTKNVVTSRRSIGSGMSFRIAKGVRYHVGGGSSQNVREDVVEKFDGRFCLTNKRVIMFAPKYGFSITYTRLMSMHPARDGIQFYDSAGKCYTMLSNDVPEICKRMSLIEI